MKLKRKLILKVFAFLAVFIAGSFLTIIYLMVSSLETSTFPDLAEVSKITKLNFSQDVRLIGSECVAWLDLSLLVALEVPEDEIEDLFPENNYKPSTTYRYLNNDNTRSHKWFRPDQIKDFKSFHYSDSTNGIGMKTLYEDSGAVRKVYILWFTT